MNTHRPKSKPWSMLLQLVERLHCSHRPYTFTHYVSGFDSCCVTLPAQCGTVVALNQHSEYRQLRHVVCALWFVQTPGKLYCSVVWSACFWNFTFSLSLPFSSAQLSRVILPLTDSVQSQQLCFEKALFMSGWDHAAIHLSSACRPAAPLFPCLS